ncbi:sugar-phosphate kinase, partial [Candidatus Aerophobetes bacterium]|nr:sugar-phosphate kinase [Candidatus Aerophobetes bacterium]
DKLSDKEAMARAKTSFLSDLKAGFALLHIDATVDPHYEGYLPLETVIKRTVELINYIEAERRKDKLEAVSYEVGTEETMGGIIDPKAFEQFLINLIRELDSYGLPKPDFIVGQTGTLIKMRGNAG